MITENFRKSILQAAISGKLTQQDNNDTNNPPIFNKLTEIEKEELAFEIPDKWGVTKLTEISEIRNGFTPSRSQAKFWNSKDIPWFTVEDIRNQGRFIYETNQYISNSAVTSSKRIVPSNSVLLCCTASIGEYALTKIDLVTNQQFNGITIKSEYKEIVDISYIYFWVQSLKNTLIELAGKTTFPFLSTKKLGNLLVPIPPIGEQKRIVEKLDQILPLIDALEKDESKLDELMQQFPDKMKDSILQAAMEGRITEQIIEDGFTMDEISCLNIIDLVEDFPFDIPENWEWVKFGDITDYKMGKTPPREKTEYWGSDCNWISIADMRGNRVIIDTKESVSSCAVDEVFRSNISLKGTLIMSFKLTVGRVSILGIDAVHNEAIISIFPKYGGEVLKHYLEKILPIITKLGKTKDAIKGKTLNSKSIKELLIPLPPLAEQRRVVKKLDILIPSIEKLNNI